MATNIHAEQEEPFTVFVNKETVLPKNGFSYIPQSKLNMDIILYRDLRWLTSSFIALDSAVSDTELSEAIKISNYTQGDTGSYYQISEIGSMPFRSIPVESMIPYQIIISLRFDNIIKYQLSSQISYNQVFMYMGSFFGFLICL